MWKGQRVKKLYVVFRTMSIHFAIQAAVEL